MSAWVLVPCLVTLREEFNRLAPGRDKGADGSIGDTAHTSNSDHAADEDSDVLRDHDGDVKNEVHALDIDSTGPWPEDFDVIVRRLVAREKGEFESTTTVGRLKYVIWNRRIAERSNGWNWRAYTLPDPHTNHAHFSARYTAAQEADTRPWGVYQEDDVAFADEKVKVTATTGTELYEPDLKAGTEVDAGSLLQLAALWGRRAAQNTDSLEASAKTIAEGQAVLDRRMAVLEDWFTKLNTPQASPEQTAALLHAALGAQSAAVGRILAAYGD